MGDSSLYPWPSSCRDEPANASRIIQWGFFLLLQVRNCASNSALENLQSLHVLDLSFPPPFPAFSQIGLSVYPLSASSNEFQECPLQFGLKPLLPQWESPWVHCSGSWKTALSCLVGHDLSLSSLVHLTWRPLSTQQVPWGHFLMHCWCKDFLFLQIIIQKWDSSSATAVPWFGGFQIAFTSFPREPVLALVLGWNSGALEEGVKVFCSKGQWYKHWAGVWLQRTFSVACSSNISTTPSEFSEENSSQSKCHYQLLVCGHKTLNSVSPFFF